ncbi:hypothetical protein HanXRQr2_Chr17g0811221 [Helianthus annuus]|uniref:Uncharacterized protein n=1 Tax=Helianthus annuus TaxID=4232 RepID=A0A9K3DIR0_HELAN|nr:hypothetical protein HanXRQr2_Chr17g0811221 [Helianthus annuus]
MLIYDFYERYLYFLTFFNNISRLTPRPASRLTPREAKGKRLDTRFSLFKPCVGYLCIFNFEVTIEHDLSFHLMYCL